MRNAKRAAQKHRRLARHRLRSWARREFLRRCVRLIRIINFADRATGRVYARLEHGKWKWRDEQRISRMLADPDVRAAIMAIGSLNEELV